MLTGPAVLPVKAGAKLSDEAARIDVTTKVLENIYRAFDFREDEDVYDSLASSVQGTLLRELYLRIKRSLVVAEQGGELSHMTALEVKECKPIAKQPNSFETTWVVTGTSEHWGHIHTRTTEYRAELKLVELDGLWKLDRFQLLDEKRIRFETKIRGNDSNK